MKSDIEILAEVTGLTNIIDSGNILAIHALNALATLREQMQGRLDELKPYLRHKDECELELRCNYCAELIVNHVNHEDDCGLFTDDESKCSCGLTEILKTV